MPEPPALAAESTPALASFQAVFTLPGDDGDDWDPVDTLRCTRCGFLIRAGAAATLTDLNTVALEHTCLST
ncbi:hypothetical protein K388_05827 [Streptomyces sp. KhCrAH-43]|uniref:hypothetical protein n=1 Tax=unclassified Streptomyces TaxID=2593676 RepID=UPI0003738259|nr:MULTISPECIES: hypothetical protein [unclassified Streptomyces]MYS33496.1 hypothetical protein [Streptomyces sp. SID4920]MYX63912.1 hypothetical protein [Streptomyces sp. SID8373]RAJ52728.1 hypothetical protein K388_05827 [Streptomyces sp. KhCrAH-43]